MGSLELGSALLGSSLDVRGDPDLMFMCLSFSIKTSCLCNSSANRNPDVQGAAFSNLGDPKGEAKIAEVLGYRICQQKE